MSKSSLYILANPHSGDKSSLGKAQWIKEHYPEWNVRVFPTAEADDEFRKMSQIQKEYRPDQDALLVIGGDGTLSKVLQVWPEREPLAYLPAGSGNDFVRDFGQQSVASLLKAVEKRETADIHVFQSERYLLLNSLGLGFDAHIIRQSESSLLKNRLNHFHLGKLTYLLYALISVFRREGVSVSLIDSKGQRQDFEEVFLFVLANTAYFGGGIMVWPESSSQTACLDLVYLEKGSFFHHIAGLLSLVFRKHQQSNRLHHQSYTAVSLVCPHPTWAQINGESLKLQEETFICKKRRFYVGKE